MSYISRQKTCMISFAYCRDMYYKTVKKDKVFGEVKQTQADKYGVSKILRHISVITSVNTGSV